MRIGDLTTGATKLRRGLQSLMAVWGETKPQWHDAASRNFEEHHLEPIVPKVREALEAINRLADVLARAQRECGSEEYYL